MSKALFTQNEKFDTTNRVPPFSSSQILLPCVFSIEHELFNTTNFHAVLFQGVEWLNKREKMPSHLPGKDRHENGQFVHGCFIKDGSGVFLRHPQTTFFIPFPPDFRNSGLTALFFLVPESGLSA